jgi:hypothetical protein
MAETCFCGETCSHVFQENVKKKVGFPVHNHCVGTHFKSCNFEHVQTLKARNSSSPTGNLKLLGITLFIFTFTAYPSNNHIIRGFIDRIYAFAKVQSSTTYLQN